jgi:hypothetical protein
MIGLMWMWSAHPKTEGDYEGGCYSHTFENERPHDTIG